jgi:hypothetical protein
MATIRISPEVNAELRFFAREFAGTLGPGELRSDGWYDVLISEDALQRLNRIDANADFAIRRLLGWGRPVPVVVAQSGDPKASR